jgi:hypothetical protein
MGDGMGDEGDSRREEGEGETGQAEGKWETEMRKTGDGRW